MKKIAIAIALLAAAPFMAHATISPITCGTDGNACTNPAWVDEHDANKSMSFGQSTTWTFDLTSDTLTKGAHFNPLTDTISGYNLSFTLSDRDGYFQDFDLALASASGTSDLIFNPNGTTTTPNHGQVLFDLQQDGKLDVTLKDAWGDFTFQKSILEVCGTVGGTPTQTSVPEPSSLALLAAGLIGIAAMRRKSAV